MDAAGTERSEGRRAARPLRTNEQIYQEIGEVMGACARDGKAPFQRTSSMPPPETPGVPAMEITDRKGNTRRSASQPARAYGTAKAQFLRAYAESRGIENPQFVSRGKAVLLMRAAGQREPIRPARKGAKYIEIPRNRAAVRVPMILPGSEANCDAKGWAKMGAAGDVARDADGKVVTRTIQLGPMAADPPAGVDTGSREWAHLELQSRPNLILALEDSYAKAAPIARPDVEQSRQAFDAMMRAAQEKWNIRIHPDLQKGELATMRTTSARRDERADGNRTDSTVVHVSTQPGDTNAGAWATSIVVAVAHACAHEQARRDPAGRPDPIAIQKAGPEAMETEAFAREDMVANIATQEFMSAAGIRFEPKARNEAIRERQALALIEPGGYERITKLAGETQRMLRGEEPNRRAQARAREVEKARDTLFPMEEPAEAPGPRTKTTLVLDAGAAVGAERPAGPDSGTNRPAGQEPQQEKTERPAR